MKKILFLLAVIAAATLGSCTQGDEPVTPLAAENGVKVVSLGDYLGSRSESDSLSNESQISHVQETAIIKSPKPSTVFL